MPSIMNTVTVSQMKVMLEYIPNSYCSLLLENNVIQSITIGNKKYVYKSSIRSFQKKFNRANYYTSSECVEILKDNYLIVDKNVYFHMSVSRLDFTVSVKKLYEKGFLKKDRFIGKYITKESFDNCVKKLKKMCGMEDQWSPKEMEEMEERIAKSVRENPPKFKHLKNRKIVGRKK